MVENVSLPERATENFRQAYFNGHDWDMDAYTRYQSAEAIEHAARMKGAWQVLVLVLVWA